MNLDQAQTLARELIDRHLGRDWRLEWNDSDRQFGGCQPNRRAIQLSRHFVRRYGRDEVLDTILHEIAHGLAPGRVKPHGREWRTIAESLGARPEPCKDALFYPEFARPPSHRRQGIVVVAVLVVIAAMVFVITSRGPGTKPTASLGSPAFASSTTIAPSTTSTIPFRIVDLGTTTTAPPAAPPALAAPPTTTATTRTTTIRQTAKQTPKTTTTVAPAQAATPAPPPPTTTTTAAPPPPTTTTDACTRNAYGDCYVAEEPCPSNLYNDTVEGADGPMTCVQISPGYWQWEYS